MQSPQPHLQTCLPVERTNSFGEVIIEAFCNEYDFLSNFYLAPLTWRGQKFSTSEHAYQWAKTDNPKEQKTILVYVMESGYEMPTTPGQAKRAGQIVTKRADWEEIRLDIMYDILIAKFTQNWDLRQKLLATGDAELIEGNSWHDNDWGACRCSDCAKEEKNNYLGKLLMRLRMELAKPSHIACLGCPLEPTDWQY
jgi:ribA/ribD-fused uncharacterized protein